MSHQVNFYLTPDDCETLESKCRETGDLVVLRSRSDSEEPCIVPKVGCGGDWLYFHVTRSDLARGIVMKPVPAQGYWTVDVLRSPVVELTLCYFDEKILRRGRIYYVDGFYGSDEKWYKKDQNFTTWARTLSAVVKKNLKRHGSDYIGSGALSWVTEGGELTE